nr:biotin/lipoyl-binding protein [Pleurocapsa sp. MO_192.B19]
MEDDLRVNNLLKLLIKRNFKLVWLILGSMMLIGCGLKSQDQSPTSQKTEPNLTNVSLEKRNTKVNVEIARLGSLTSKRQYTGTTQPQQEVAWRSQTEGTLLELAVEVGDQVSKGQQIGQIDDRLLATDVAGREAELAALKSELAQAKIQVRNAQIRQEEVEIQLEQAKNDAARYQELAKTGL